MFESYFFSLLMLKALENGRFASTLSPNHESCVWSEDGLKNIFLRKRVDIKAFYE